MQHGLRVGALGEQGAQARALPARLFDRHAGFAEQRPLIGRVGVGILCLYRQGARVEQRIGPSLDLRRGDQKDEFAPDGHRPAPQN